MQYTSAPAQPQYREILPSNIDLVQLHGGTQLKRFFVTLPADIEAGMTLAVLLDNVEFTVLVPDDARPCERVIVCVPLGAFPQQQQQQQQQQPQQGSSAAASSALGAQHIDGVATVIRDKSSAPPAHFSTQAYSLGPIGSSSSSCANSSSSYAATVSISHGAGANACSTTCPACTFISAQGALACEMCGGAVGAGVGLPVATAMVDSVFGGMGGKA